METNAATLRSPKDILLGVIAAVDEDYRAKISKTTKTAYQRKKNLAGGGPVK